jgi:molecular chaperone GrpE
MTPDDDSISPDTQPEESAATAPADDPDILRAKAAERDEYLDRLKRTMAEFQNYKHRVGREKADLRKFVTGEAIRALLPAIDNLERAVLAGGDAGDNPLVSGVRMVIEQMGRALDQLGVKPVETANAKFDPGRMEAVASIETDDAEENTVLDVFEKGYMIDDFVIRPARVSVAAAKTRG